MTVRRLVQFIIRLVRGLVGRTRIHRVEVRCSWKVLGSAYGGWAVHLKSLDSKSIVYSAGVGEDISFDKAVMDRTGGEVYAFDPTPRSIEWLDTQHLPPGFHFYPWALGDFDGKAQFYPPANRNHVSHSLLARPTGDPVQVDVRRMRTIMRELGHAHVDVLKLDIEGSEYDVIPDLIRSSVSIGQILIEFHHEWPITARKETQAAVDLLRSEGFRIYWVSDSGREYSFIRRWNESVSGE